MRPFLQACTWRYIGGGNTWREGDQEDYITPKAVITHINEIVPEPLPTCSSTTPHSSLMCPVCMEVLMSPASSWATTGPHSNSDTKNASPRGSRASVAEAMEVWLGIDGRTRSRTDPLALPPLGELLQMNQGSTAATELHHAPTHAARPRN